MAHFKLGQVPQAKARLDQLRQLLKQPRWANEAEASLREAESLIEARPDKPKR